MKNGVNIKSIISELSAKKSYFVFFIIIPLVTDIITKYIILNTLTPYDTIPVINGFFNIVYVLNPGAAFGFLKNLDASYRQLLLTAVAAAAVIIIFIMFIKEKRRAAVISLSLIISGASGNMIDRIRIGKVVDFLDFYIKSYHWPAFNVADICITCGVALMIADILFSKKKI